MEVEGGGGVGGVGGTKGTEAIEAKYPSWGVDWKEGGGGC